jgi:glycosyltransferase involved in cell wall biosynthesis
MEGMMMKYLFVAPRFHTNSVPIVEELIKQGNLVEFYVQYKGYTEDYSFVTPKVIKQTFVSKLLGGIIDKKNTINAATIKKSIFFTPALFSLLMDIKEFRPDVVIVRDRIVSSLFTYWICKFLKIEKVFLYNQLPQFVERKGNKRARTKNFVYKKFFPKYRITVVMHDIYPDEDKKNSLIKDDFTFFVPFVMTYRPELLLRDYCKEGIVRILDVGKYRDYKNHFVLVNAINLMKNKESILVTIIGQNTNSEEAAYYNSLKDFINKYELTDRIRLLCNVKFKDMEKHYLENDIFVLTSRKEVASVSVLEAMSYGLATISTNVNGTASYIQKGYNGDVFETNNAYDLARILDDLVIHRTTIAAFGQNAIKTVRENHSPNSYVKSIERIIDQVFN